MTVSRFRARKSVLLLCAAFALAVPAFAQVPMLPVPTGLSVLAEARLNPVILRPDPAPAIHGPKIVGTTPRHPFLFLVPATGTPPLTYACSDLPAGLMLNARSGILSGAVSAAGVHTLHLSVSNAQGTAHRTLILVAEQHRLALTPPMGWDAVNFYADQINDARARGAADWLVKSGLAAHGYAYIHVNDTWQGLRDKQTGKILPNLRRFPDMRGLADYLHTKGLKFGLYSSATEHTCAGYPGSAGHAAQDAATYASWGVDYLEYSWCPLADLDTAHPPSDQRAAFLQMSHALNQTHQDIVYAVNTFGKGEPWNWAASVGANTWATSPTFLDNWNSIRKNFWGMPSLKDYQQPGHWNSPGLLMVGKFGFEALRKTNLTDCEQMSQMSQCALMSAPLWLSCDLASLDPNKFHPSVTAMLTNDEVIDVDQDPAGKGATLVADNPDSQIWAKPMSDGTLVVGLYNISPAAETISVDLRSLNLSGSQPVRDLWLHRDLPAASQTLSADVPSHGVALVKLGTPEPPNP